LRRTPKDVTGRFQNPKPAAKRSPTVWLIPYNLIDEQTVKRAAIDDPDLKPLWNSLGGTSWKRVDQTPEE
jgi:hypothetical protein